MSFNKFEEWERTVDAKSQVKKRQEKAEPLYGIAQQYGVVKKLSKQISQDSIEKKKKAKVEYKSKTEYVKKQQGFSFNQLANLDVDNKELNKKSKVEKWLEANKFSEPNARKPPQSPLPSSSPKSSSSPKPPLNLHSKTRPTSIKSQNVPNTSKHLPRETTGSSPKLKSSSRFSFDTQNTIKRETKQTLKHIPQKEKKPICIDSSDSSESDSQKENTRKRKEIKAEPDDGSEDFSPKSQKKLKHYLSNDALSPRTPTSKIPKLPKLKTTHRSVSTPTDFEHNYNPTESYKSVFVKSEKVDTLNIKREKETGESIFQQNELVTNVSVKKETKSPAKSALRPASFILKPKGEDACCQTTIDTNTLKELMNVTDLPTQLIDDTAYRFTVDLGNDQFVHRKSRVLCDSKKKDLTKWFTYILDNYKSKKDYKGEDGCNCFITLDSRYMVMLSRYAEVPAVVEVLTDGSMEDNWMRNIRDPIRIVNVIEKHLYSTALGELAAQLPEFITTRLFPKLD